MLQGYEPDNQVFILFSITFLSSLGRTFLVIMFEILSLDSNLKSKYQANNQHNSSSSNNLTIILQVMMLQQETDDPGWLEEEEVSTTTIELVLEGGVIQSYSTEDGQNLAEPSSNVKDQVLNLPKLNTDRKQFTCPQCEKVFTKKSNLASHMGLHTPGLRKHSCSQCSETFAWKSSLNRHTEKVHQNTQTMYPCQFCDKQYKLSSILSDHVKRDHFAERSHQCELCPKAFFKLNDLKYHKRVHLSIKPYVCRFVKNVAKNQYFKTFLFSKSIL